MNESIVQKGINGINQLAETIAGSEYWKKVVPGMKQLQQEAGARILSRDSSVFDAGKISEASNMIATALHNAQGKPINGDEFEKYAKEIASKIKSVDDVDKIFKENESILGGRDWKPLAKKIKDSFANKRTSEQAFKEAKILEKITTIPQAYFTNPDDDIRKARIGTAVAGYATASVGGRYLSGGTLTRDSYGRDDIAGIPFV